MTEQTARARALDLLDQVRHEVDIATTRDPGINERGVTLLDKAVEAIQIAQFMLVQIDAPENQTRKVRATV